MTKSPFGNLGGMMKQAKALQDQLEKLKEEVSSKTVTASAGGGMVKVVLTGSQELKSISLNPEAVDPDDVEMLEDLIIAAFTTAQEKVKSLSDSTMGSITGGMNFPGM